MHERRALTLVELLTALGLLSVIALGVVSWIATSAQAQRVIGERIRFESAARALFERIFEDVVSGDLPLGDEQERIRIENDSLVIQTRLIGDGGGQVTRTYTFNQRPGLPGQVEVQIKAAQQTQTRFLLGDVAAFACVLEASDAPDDEITRTLTIELTSRSGQYFKREIPLP